MTQGGLVRHRRARNDAPDSIRNHQAAESEHSTCFFDADTHPSRENRDVSLASYCTLRETATSVETIGPMTTESHRQVNQLTAVVTGTWIDDDAHSGTLMTGHLLNFQNGVSVKSR